MRQYGYPYFDCVFHFGIFAMGAVSRHQLYVLVFFCIHLTCTYTPHDTGTFSAPELDVFDFLRQFVTERC
jgi:hypothetical protein